MTREVKPHKCDHFEACSFVRALSLTWSRSVSATRSFRWFLIRSVHNAIDYYSFIVSPHSVIGSKAPPALQG
jgi:hypothetical protein